jgi:hypothetical protein
MKSENLNFLEPSGPLQACNGTALHFILAWNSTCCGQFVCPSSGVYSLYTQQWCMSYRFVDNFRAGPCWSKAVYKPVWHTPLLSVQWMNSWWWTEELSETCRVSCQNKFVKLVHLVGFIIKEFHEICFYGVLLKFVIPILVKTVQEQQHNMKICMWFYTHLKFHLLSVNWN